MHMYIGQQLTIDIQVAHVLCGTNCYTLVHVLSSTSQSIFIHVSLGCLGLKGSQVKRPLWEISCFHPISQLTWPKICELILKE